MPRTPRFAAVYLTVLLLVVGLLPPLATAADIRLTVNGQELFTDPPPQVMDGRTMVPVRFVAEALGAAVQYDPEGPGVFIRHPERGEYYLFLKEPTARWPDGSRQTLDVPAQIISGRTMVPLRFVSEALGAKVTWDGDTRTVHIASGPGAGTAPAPLSPPPLPAAGLDDGPAPHLMYTFPAPPRADRIRLTAEPDGWHLQVTGQAGAVLPRAQVLVSAVESSDSVLTRADGQGGFSARVVAAPGSFVQVKHDPLNRLTRDNIAMGRPHEVNLAYGTLLRVPTPDDAVEAATGSPGIGSGTGPAPASVRFHAPGQTQLGEGEGNPTMVPWVFAGTLSGLTGKPGARPLVDGEVRLYLPAAQAPALPPALDANLSLERLSRADGSTVLMRELFMSTTMTPSGLPINRFGGGEPPAGAGISALPGQIRRVDAQTVAFTLRAEVPLPADLETGTYRLRMQLWLPDFQLPRPLFTTPLKPIFTQREAGIALLPPFTIGPAATVRLPWMLLADTPSQGSRGAVAQGDPPFQLQSMIVHQTDTFIIPREDPGTGQPIAYRLEPHLPTVSVADRGLVNTPSVAFKLPGGRLRVRVERPDGKVDDLGEAPFTQSMNSSPQTFAGSHLDNGGGNAGDLYQLSTGSDRFLYRFPGDGRYRITMEGEAGDIWGNRYIGGGQYEVWVARTLDLKPAILPSTPLQVGNTVATAVQVYPAVPAEVEWRWRFYPESQRTRMEEKVLKGAANRFGFFHPGQGPKATGPGEYRLDILGRYTDPQGGLWMGSMTWGQVVEKPGTPLVLHGRRGVDSDPDIGNAWFLRRNTGIPPGGNHFNFAYHSGDISWQTADDAIQVRLSLQDTQGQVSSIIQQRARGADVESPPHGDFADRAQQRIAAGEAPIASTTPSLVHPAFHPDQVDQRGYWYGGVARPDVRVRQMVSEDFASITYWRFQELYGGQLGAGVRGEALGDLKWQFGGAVWSHQPNRIYETAIYASMWALIPDSDAQGSRTMPPFRGNGGGPDGGPVITLAGHEYDLFLLPLVVRPGSVLMLGDRFGFAGEVGPPVEALVRATVTSPSGKQRQISGQANKVGYFYDPGADFTLDEPGVWTVQAQVEKRGNSSIGPLTPPYPTGGILGSPSGVYRFFVAPAGGQQLDWNAPAAARIPGYGPVQLAGRVPDGWQDVRVDYVIGSPGYLLAEGQAPVQNGVFTVPFNPPALAQVYPHIDLQSRYDQGPGLSDTFTVSLMIRGRDGKGQPTALARLITVQGPEWQAPLAQAGP